MNGETDMSFITMTDKVYREFINIVKVGGELESLTNPDGTCEVCKHSAPDHWKSCPLDMVYWRCLALAHRMRKDF